MRPVYAGVPEGDYLQKIGLIVFLVSEFEGTLLYDLLRLEPHLPLALNFSTIEGMRITGMTTQQMGKYFAKHAADITDVRVAEYYRVGGAALEEIGPKRNAMLHSRPGFDGDDPVKRLRLVRMRIDGPERSEGFLIGDKRLDELIERLDVLRRQVEIVRPA